MSQTVIDVYLICGFLGSGKTTFLNHLLNQSPPEYKLLILMNEFGEEGIDGTLIEDPELEMVEVSKGSIFCSCVKGDFIKALYRIATVIKPDVLVIEASGVANPSDLGRDLATPIFKDAFNLRHKFCLVDAAYFLDHFETFAAVEKQIASSDWFIINKTDLADAGAIARIKEIIRQHHPDPKFFETTYAKLDLDRLFGEGILAPAAGAAPAAPSGKAGPLLSEQELETVVDQILDDQAGQTSPPDRLISITCRWRDGSLADFQAIAQDLPPDVVRAKGFLFADGQVYLYNQVGKTQQIEPYAGRPPDNSGVNRVVFIRSGFEQDDILGLFQRQGLELMASGEGA